MPKYFILDTNVLIHNWEAIYSFSDNVVVIPIQVLEELDNLKKSHDDRGRSVRKVVRELDQLRLKGHINEGVPMENGGTILVYISDQVQTVDGLDIDKMDNKIINTALKLKKDGKNVIFVSKDINARIKADALGITSVDFEKQKINIEELYQGFKEVYVDDKEIDRFYSNKKLDSEIIDAKLYANEFLLLKSNMNEKKTAICKYSKEDNQIVPLFHEETRPWGIKALNVKQKFAIEALMCDEINIVTLVGGAGTGKTLLALAAGLEKVVELDRFRKILVSRPIIPLGKDIGYLPGSKTEKLGSWMQPIFDNLEFLLYKKSDQSQNSSFEHTLDFLTSKDLIELEAVTYIRGRSLPHQFFIVDEAQNLTPHEIKTIVSRAGEDTKVVLTGDPYQIDNPYLDANSNGLTYLVERFKGEEIFAHITLTKTERSKLSELAAKKL